MSWAHLRIDEPIIEIDPNNGCWLWMGRLDRDGYSRLGGKGRLGHGAFYEIVRGPIPSGLTIDHLCRVRNCVNPDHMEAVTHKENTRYAMPNISASSGRLRKRVA